MAPRLDCLSLDSLYEVQPLLLRRLTDCRMGAVVTVRVLRMNAAIIVEGRVEKWRERAL